jgi:5'-methylthioadenosine phosphorylase
MPEIALIAGSGLESSFKLGRNLQFETPYGAAGAYEMEILGTKVLFLPRHGRGHTVPPHMVNYRANVFALREAGVTRVIATNAVGSLRERIRPGDFVVPDQFIDFTRARPSTFFDGVAGEVVHTDVTEAYSPEVRKALISSFAAEGDRFHRKGVYVCTEGPRYETPAEIVAFRRLGGDVVGMTGCPEAALAKELGLGYATLCIVTNYGAGMQKRVQHAEVVRLMEKASDKVRHVVKGAVESLAKARPK